LKYNNYEDIACYYTIISDSQIVSMEYRIIGKDQVEWQFFFTPQRYTWSKWVVRPDRFELPTY